MSNITKNVFISHVHEDDAALGKLRSLLEKHGVSIRDASINSKKPNEANNHDYIKSSILAPQINWAGTLLVHVSPDTKHSDWVNWEIEYAAKLGKRIVGVWEHGSKDCELPAALEEYADAVVGWSGNAIVDAIVKEKDGWEMPDGGACPPVPLTRHPC